MRNLTIFLSILTGLFLPSYAHHISSQEAKEIASQFITSSVRRTKSQNINLNRVKADSEPIDDINNYYIFNTDDNNGFVIVSGDDRAPKIIGYSNSGSFSYDNIPPALKWVFSVYDKYFNNLNTDSKSELMNYDWESISPLLTSKWGQGEPYNNQCPIIDGFNAPTGCVATAVAQIINYHQWPVCGEGTFSYLWDDKTLSYNYEANPFNWELMPDICDNSTSMEEISEISKLMSACGIGVEMFYTSNASGSGIAQVKRFLLENMKYSKDMSIVWPYNYSSNQWRELIYDELSKNRPVYMEGNGHAFVCDGYSDSGYFHFNWGWGGDMDGYFLLNELTPDPNVNYWIDLNALVNIKAKENNEGSFTYDLYNSGGVYFDNNEIYSGYIWNNSRYEYNKKIGFEAFNKVDGKSTYLTIGIFTIDGATPMGGGVFRECKQWKTSTDGIKLSQGNYMLYLVYERESDVFSRIPTLAGAQEYIELNVDNNGNHYYSNPAPLFIPNIKVSDVTFINDDYLSSSESDAANTYIFKLKYLLHNYSEYPVPEPIIIVKNIDGKIIFNSSSTSVFEPNKINEHAITILPVYMRPGMHTLTICDFTGKKLIDNYEFTVLGPGSDIEVDEILDSSISFGTEVSAMEMILNMNTSWVTNIPCRIEFYQDNDLKFEVETVLDGIYQTDKAIRVILPIRNEDMLSPGEYDVLIFDSNYNHPLNSNSLKVTVPEIPVLGINFSKQLYECQVGETFNLDYEIIPYWCNESKLEWESSNTFVATIDETGTVKALNPGETEITAIYNYSEWWCLYSHCHLTVHEQISSISEINAQDVEVYIENDAVNVISTSSEDVLRISALDGSIIYEGTCNRVPLQKGIYILTLNNTVIRKVII